MPLDLAARLRLPPAACRFARRAFLCVAAVDALGFEPVAARLFESRASRGFDVLVVPLDELAVGGASGPLCGIACGALLRVAAVDALGFEPSASRLLELRTPCCLDVLVVPLDELAVGGASGPLCGIACGAFLCVAAVDALGFEPSASRLLESCAPCGFDVLIVSLDELAVGRAPGPLCVLARGPFPCVATVDALGFEPVAACLFESCPACGLDTLVVALDRSAVGGLAPAPGGLTRSAFPGLGRAS
ncbi:MAG: hypothetical protein H6836_01600 [Planctomycetes bacterium]|nr:hypothetical protein [Planctomycetota bacterium]